MGKYNLFLESPFCDIYFVLCNVILCCSECRIRIYLVIIELVHEISNNVVCSTSKASDQPAHTRSLIRAFASRLSIL